MVVLGVILVVLALLVLLAAVFGGTDSPASLDLQILTVDTNAMGVFLLGCATVLVFVAGLEMLRSGVRRSWRRRKELKHARQVVAEHDSTEQRRRRPADPGDQTDAGRADEPPTKEPPPSGR